MFFSIRLMRGEDLRVCEGPSVVAFWRSIVVIPLIELVHEEEEKYVSTYPEIN